MYAYVRGLAFSLLFNTKSYECFFNGRKLASIRTALLKLMGKFTLISSYV